MKATGQRRGWVLEQAPQVVGQGVVDGGFHRPVKAQHAFAGAVLQAVFNVVLAAPGGASGQNAFLAKVLQGFFVCRPSFRGGGC